MATKPTVKQNTGIFAVGFCCVAIVLCYAFYLVKTNQDLDVQAIALASAWYQVKPLWAREIISKGGYLGTLSAVLLMMFQGLLYSAVAFVSAYLALKFVDEKPEKDEAKASLPGSTNGVNDAEIPGSDLMVILPSYPGPKKGTMLGGAVDKSPYKQSFYRIKQAVVPTKQGIELNAYQNLYVAIYGMLKAHPDVPASIGGHHADAPLFEHSLTVSKKLQAHFVSRNKPEPLAAIAGIAHDLDKLLAYKKKGAAWTKNVNATHHNKYAAYIVSTQPEFKALPEDDRNTLVLALRYYHDNENLPIGSTNRTEALIHALRLCDGYAIKEEKAAGVDTLSNEQMEAIEKALLNTITELNINGYLNKAGHAGGWTTPALEYVITPMSTVLELMGKHLPADLNRKLQLDHETRTFKHPAARIVSERLNKLGMLMTTYKAFSSESGLYNCRIGNTRFMAVLMLQKSVLDELIPGLQDKWDTSAYRIRITGATPDHTVQGEDDVEEED